MLHRAIRGSLERFVGILIENTGGWLPLWMTPTQAVIAGISDKHVEYCESVRKSLQSSGLRIKHDQRSEKIGYKIREHALAKIPYMVIVGDQEIENGTISVRGGQGEKYDGISLEQFVSMIQEVVVK